MTMPDLDVRIRERLWSLSTSTEPGSVADLEHRLDEFEEWFAGESWDERTALAADVDLLLAERDAFGTEELIDRLKRLASVVEVGKAPAVGSSINKTIRVGERQVTGQTIRRNLEFAGR